jgi:hypothetical protein
MPTQLTGRHGISLAGAQYVDTGIIDPFERTDRFTLFAAISGAGAAATNGTILCSWDTASYRGINWGSNIDLNQLVLTTDLLGNKYVSVQHTVPGYGSFHTRAATYSGTSTAAGVALYEHGALVTPTIAKDTLDGTIKGGNSFLIGGRRASGVKSGRLVGNVHNIFIFPWELTAQQVQYLHRYCLNNINAA